MLSRNEHVKSNDQEKKQQKKMAGEKEKIVQGLCTDQGVKSEIKRKHTRAHTFEKK